MIQKQLPSLLTVLWCEGKQSKSKRRIVLIMKNEATKPLLSFPAARGQSLRLTILPKFVFSILSLTPKATQQVKAYIVLLNHFEQKSTIVFRPSRKNNSVQLLRMKQEWTLRIHFGLSPSTLTIFTDCHPKQKHFALQLECCSQDHRRNKIWAVIIFTSSLLIKLITLFRRKYGGCFVGQSFNGSKSKPKSVRFTSRNEITSP